MGQVRPEEELRIALVMNGGVSLAVWMGGVSNEIFRLVTGQHAVYSRLLDMTRSTARVDVISGTSAGGVNGAALAIALLYGGDFSELRKVWLETGALADLLRSPLGKNPGSLLKGDDFFLPQIQSAFEQLAAEPKPIFKTNVMPIDLRLTTTLLTGVQGNTVDDLGSRVHDVDYRAHFRFLHVGNHSDFDDQQQILSSLARAARSTASFPFAFEPSRVSAANGGKHLNDARDMPVRPLSRFVIDGGILDNKPFRGALTSIFSMRAHGSVRRVLTYINPDPGDGAPGKPGGPVPSLASVLSASVLGIPQSQSISDQLQEIKDHNDRVRTRRDSVVTLVQLLRGNNLDGLPAKLFQVYRRRRLLDVFEGFVYDELPIAAQRHGDGVGNGLSLLGKRGREQLLQVFIGLPWSAWLPPQWPERCEDDAYRVATWQWGLFPVEFAAKILLDLLRKAQLLQDFAKIPPQGTRSAQASGVPAPAPAPPPEVSVESSDWGDAGSNGESEDGGLMPKIYRMAQRVGDAMSGPAKTPDIPAQAWARETQRAAERSATLDPNDELGQCWHDAYEVIEQMTAMRRQEQDIWDRNADQLLRKLRGRSPTAEKSVDFVRPEDFEQMFAFLASPQRINACGTFAHRLASIFRRACPLAGSICDLSKTNLERLRQHDLKAADELQSLVSYFAQPGSDSESCILLKVMQLEVVEFAFNNHDELSSDALIELVQVSGNSRSPLGGRSEAKDKLLGLQLAHFGAFYKQSWRANDWTFGRLDGAERMVKILLNPDRLHRFYFGQAEVAALEIEDIAWKSVGSSVLYAEIEQLWKTNGYAAKIRRDLAFLDDVNAPMPDSLPACADVVTMRLHFGILREELPELLLAIASDQAQGSDAFGAGEALLSSLGAAARSPGAGVPTRPFSPEEAKRALERGLIADERLVDEAGSDLFTRTLAHTAATLQSLLASKTAKLGPVSWLFSMLKVPMLGFYFVARTLTRQSRTSAALHAGIMAVGLAIVFMQFLFVQPNKAGAPSAVVAFGWAALAYGLLLSAVRAPRTVGLLLLAVIGVSAWRAQTPGVILAASVILLLALAAKWAWVQWAIGFLVIGFAAMWSAGELPDTPAPRGADVFMLAASVCAVILLAMWQTSPWSTAVELAAKRFWRWLGRLW